MTAEFRIPALFALALASIAESVPATVGPWAEQGQARVRLISGWSAAAPGADPRLGLEFELAEGWHVYWKNAGDAGYPPELALGPPGALTDVELRFPAPERFDLPGDLISFGYEKRVVYPIDASVAPGLSTAVEIRGELDYLVCRETCIPYRAELRLELPLGAPALDTQTSAALDEWRARLPAPAGTPGAPTVAGRIERGAADALELALDFSGAELVAVAPELFFEAHPLLALERPRFAASAAGPGFRIALRPLDSTRPLPDELSFAWTVTGLESAAGVDSFEGRTVLAVPAVRRGSALPLAALATILATMALLVSRRRRSRRPATVDRP